jgi:two-component system, NtrC family, sensor histidine kinase AtoS
MNRSASFPIRTNPLWRGKSSSASVDLEVLLNGLAVPACLIDKSKDVILYANPLFQRMTEFTSIDVSSAKIADILPDWDTGKAILNEPALATLKTRLGESLPVNVHSSVIDPTSQWILVTFVERMESGTFPGKQHQELINKILNLYELINSNDVQHYLELALEVVAQTLKVDGCCLYRAEADRPELVAVSRIGDAEFLPQTIPSSDLIRLSHLTLWQPGRPVHTEMHRAARVSNMASVVSVALGDSGALSGLLVVVRADRKINERQMEMIQFFGGVFGSLLQNYVLINNLIHTTRTSEQLLTVYRQLFESSQEGMLILSNDLDIKEINSAAELMLGYAASEVNGQPVENVVIGSSEILRSFEAACTGDPTHNTGTVFLHRRNGQAFPSNIRVFPVIENESVSMIIVLIVDISENEQIRVRTQQLEQRAFLGDFTAVFAHEVRNPINNISTGLQLLASLIDPNDPNQDVISRMLGDCTRLNQLMESILSFSRPMEIKLEKVDLSGLIKRILDRWRPRFARVNVVPYFQSDEHLPMILADPRSLEQVFTNLISNAVDAMSKNGGTLAVKLSNGPSIGSHSQVEVTVSDNGPGIPDEVRERIFEPFVTTNPRGNGLGLAITKRIVTAHHGSIGLNTFPGGTVFHVCLPAEIGENK